MKFNSRDNATVARPDSRRRRNALRLQPTMKLGCEALEVRITPTTSVWTGAGAGTNPNWTNAANWSGSVAPVAGNALDFPNGATSLANINDFPAGTSFSSIKIDASGYGLPGNAITLTGGIAATNLSVIELPIAITGTETISEAAGSQLVFTNAGVISGSGSLVQSGPGELVFQTPPSYTGSTTVSGGILYVSGSIASSSGTTVDSTGTLGGYGTVGAVTSIGGTIGYTTRSSASHILTGTSLSLDGGSTFHALVNGTRPGGKLNGHDQVVLSGALALGGATLNLTNNSAYTPAAGDSIDLIKGATSSTGAFNGHPEGSTLTFQGQPFTITYLGGTGGHDVVLNFVQSTTSTVVTSSANPSTFGSAVTLSATVTASAGTPTGNVTFFDGATVLGTSTLDGSGVASITTSALPTGTDSITAVYSGDAGDQTSTSDILTQTVSQAATTSSLTVSPGVSEHGQLTVLTATVTSTAGTPTGTVSFFEGATPLGTVALGGSGIATFSTANLPTGSGTITAIYNGDTNYSGSSANAPSLVINDTTSTQLSSPTPSTFGQSITLTATVTPDFGGIPTGTMAYFDGATLLGITLLDVTGTATFSDANLAVGSHSITAVYSGDVNDGGSTSFATQTVSQAATTSVVTATPNPSVFGQSVTFTASAVPLLPGSGIPTGTVSFFDGATLLGTGALSGGIATLTSSVLSVGEHSITAVYGGAVNFTGATSLVSSETVTRAATTVLLTTPQSVQTFGQAIAITAQVDVSGQASGSAIGTLTFSEGSTVLAVLPAIGGTATYAPTGLGTGAHVITATYSGDGNFNSGSSQTTQTVVAASTYSILTTSAQVAIFGQPITYSASSFSIAPGIGVPTGTIAFYDGSTLIGSSALVNGLASLTVTASGTGAVHNVHAVYTPDSANFLTHTTGDLHDAVIKSNSSVLYYYQVSPNGVGFSTTVLATTPGAGVPTGTLTYYVNGQDIGSQQLVNGQAGIFVPRHIARGKTFSVAYSGDANHNASVSKPITITQAILNGGSSPIQIFRAKMAKAVRGQIG